MTQKSDAFFLETIKPVDPLSDPIEYAGDVTPLIPLRMHATEWNRVEYPLLSASPDQLGRRIFELVAQRTHLGTLPFEVWLFSNNSIQMIAPQQALNPIELAAMSGMSGVEQMAVLSELWKVEHGERKRLAHVYIEDQQGLWWFGSQALSEDGSVIVDEPAVEQALEDGKPVGMGGWFALSRRLQLRGKLQGGLDS